MENMHKRFCVIKWNDGCLWAPPPQGLQCSCITCTVCIYTLFFVFFHGNWRELYLSGFYMPVCKIWTEDFGVFKQGEVKLLKTKLKLAKRLYFWILVPLFCPFCGTRINITELINKEANSFRHVNFFVTLNDLQNTLAITPEGQDDQHYHPGTKLWWIHKSQMFASLFTTSVHVQVIKAR